jgi:ubiquinone/menaquinone biosynthesis C-methylase UbiE
MRTLTHQEAQAFYDRLGARQDWQRFFEDPAVCNLTDALSLADAQSVLEFGCGTGRLAEHLLIHRLPASASYLALDISTTMVRLASRRLARFGPRVKVVQSRGEMALAVETSTCDRFLSVYVLDLLSEADIRTLLAEAHRILIPRGWIGLVSLGHGTTLTSRLLERLWVRIHSLRPRLVGGCRPLDLIPFVQAPMWEVRHHKAMTRFGFCSEIVAAER